MRPFWPNGHESALLLLLLVWARPVPLHYQTGRGLFLVCLTCFSFFATFGNDWARPVLAAITRCNVGHCCGTHVLAGIGLAPLLSRLLPPHHLLRVQAHTARGRCTRPSSQRSRSWRSSALAASGWGVVPSLFLRIRYCRFCFFGRCACTQSL